MKVKIKEGNSM